MVKNPHYRRSHSAAAEASKVARTARTSGRAAGGVRAHARAGARTSNSPIGSRPARFRRLRIAVVGAGDVGYRLVAALNKRLGTRVAVLVTTRRADQAQRLRQFGARVLALDLDASAPRTRNRLAGWPQIVIQLAPPPAEGGDDPRTRRLLAMLSRPPDRTSAAHGNRAANAPACWVYSSTTGVYGDLNGRWADETQAVAPTSARAARRVAAERRWRQSGAAGSARTPIVRVPGIYAADRLPVDRLQKQLPALLPEVDVYTNHINADDLAWTLWITALRGRSNRVYHAVDDSDLKMGDYFDQVADRLALPRPPRLGRAEIAQAVSPAMWSFMSESRRLRNGRLRHELRVRLRYPTVRDTLAAC